MIPQYLTETSLSIVRIKIFERYAIQKSRGSQFRGIFCIPALENFFSIPYITGNSNLQFEIQREHHVSGK